MQSRTILETYWTRKRNRTKTGVEYVSFSTQPVVSTASKRRDKGATPETAPRSISLRRSSGSKRDDRGERSVVKRNRMQFRRRLDGNFTPLRAPANKPRLLHHRTLLKTQGDELETARHSLPRSNASGVGKTRFSRFCAFRPTRSRSKLSRAKTLGGLSRTFQEYAQIDRFVREGGRLRRRPSFFNGFF